MQLLSFFSIQLLSDQLKLLSYQLKLQSRVLDYWQLNNNSLLQTFISKLYTLDIPVLEREKKKKKKN